VNAVYDLLIIGGGINGVGIARDAAGRGLKVMLCEKNDLASSTSSSSSKLIHGGLRYLESYEFRLVREALAERETLLNIAPHIIWPLRFVLPIEKGMRPAWMIRIGLFLYDHLAKRAVLPGTKALKLRHSLQGKPLQPQLTKGFEYSDCWADDARLVVLNAMDAAERGATIATRTECLSLERSPAKWTATLRNAEGGTYQADARVVVNAAGPWVDDLLGRMGRRANRGHLRLVKGSHIVTRKLYDGDHAYIFQSGDGRVIFAIPYEDDYTLIGTTEQDWSHDQGEVKISDEETRYLCDTINLYFAKAITPADVVWSYAGVRPLFDDQNESASVVTRDYVFDLDDGAGAQAPALSIFGGKLTTYRKLAQQALEKLAPYFPTIGQSWTAGAALPGGDFPAAEVAQLRALHAAQWPWLAADQIDRMTSAYGTRMAAVIGEAKSARDLGRHFGGGLTESEVKYLINKEFVETADDILWRRSKLGLRLSMTEQEALAAYLSPVLAAAPA
jgi:glycerol-3-phosphate dehydrogenase